MAMLDPARLMKAAQAARNDGREDLAAELESHFPQQPSAPAQTGSPPIGDSFTYDPQNRSFTDNPAGPPQDAPQAPQAPVLGSPVSPQPVVQTAAPEAPKRPTRNQAFLDLVYGGEAPGAEGHNTAFGMRQSGESSFVTPQQMFEGRKLSELNLDEVVNQYQPRLRDETKAAGFGKGSDGTVYGTSAVGRGQFVQGTLKESLGRLGITPDKYASTQFTPELQDRVTLDLAMTKRGLDPNNVEDWMDDPEKLKALGNEWESLDSSKGKISNEKLREGLQKIADIPSTSTRLSAALVRAADAGDMEVVDELRDARVAELKKHGKGDGRLTKDKAFQDQSRVLLQDKYEEKLKQANSFAKHAEVSSYMRSRLVDAREEAEKINPANMSPEEIGKWGVEAIGEIEYNIVTMGKAYFGKSSDAVNRARALSLNDYQSLDNWTAAGTKRAAKGILSDPTTYVGVSSLANAGRVLFSKAAAKEAGKAFFKSAFSRGATEGAVEGGVFAAADNLGRQGIAVEGGLQDSIDGGEVALSGAAGVGLGAGLGGPLGKVLGPATAQVAGKGDNPIDSSVAQLLRTKADQMASEGGEGLTGKDILDNINVGSDGAMKVLNNVRTDLNEKINGLWAVLKQDRPGITPRGSSTLQGIIDAAAGQGVVTAGKRKVQNTISDYTPIEKLVGDTAEGQELIQALKQIDRVSKMLQDGVHGGVSKYTDLLNVTPQLAGKTIASSLTGVKMMGTLGMGSASGGGTFLAQGGIVGAGLMIDKLTGRRSKVARFVKKHGGGTPGEDFAAKGYESIRENKLKAQAAEAKAKADRKAHVEGQIKAHHAASFDSDVVPQGGWLRTLYSGSDKWEGLGLTPKELDKGAQMMLSRGQIDAEQYRLFKEDPKSLMEDETGYHMSNIWGDMINKGELKQHKDWLDAKASRTAPAAPAQAQAAQQAAPQAAPKPFAQPQQQGVPNVPQPTQGVPAQPQVHIKNPAAYQAAAEGNQARVTAAVQQALNTQFSSPEVTTRIATAAAAIGQVTTKQEARKLINDALRHLSKEDQEKGMAILKPLVEDKRHDGPVPPSGGPGGNVPPVAPTPPAAPPAPPMQQAMTQAAPAQAAAPPPPVVTPKATGQKVTYASLSKRLAVLKANNAISPSLHHTYSTLIDKRLQKAGDLDKIISDMESDFLDQPSPYRDIPKDDGTLRTWSERPEHDSPAQDPYRSSSAEIDRSVHSMGATPPGSLPPMQEAIDPEGRKVKANWLVGLRSKKTGEEMGLSIEQIRDLAHELADKVLLVGPNTKFTLDGRTTTIGKDARGFMSGHKVHGTTASPVLAVNNQNPPQVVERTLRHETGHAIDSATGLFTFLTGPSKGSKFDFGNTRLTSDLGFSNEQASRIISDLHQGMRITRPDVFSAWADKSPSTVQWRSQPVELIAEALFLYTKNPTAYKKQFPDSAAFIRKVVNEGSQSSVKFLTVAPLAAAMYGASQLGDQSEPEGYS